MKHDSLYIIMPAYNEEKNIGAVIEQWYPVVEKIGGDSRLVVLNDGSKDGTYEKIRKYQEKYDRLIGIDKPNEGHGGTILKGYHYAVDAGADYVFQTDTDGQTLPEEFEPFWDQKESYDMVIGWRNNRQDGENRIFVTKTLRFVIRICFGVSVTDANTPFRLMQAETLQKYIGLIPKDFNLSNVILSVIYAKKGCRVKYIPITFRPRQGGVNSINMKKIFGIGRQAVRDFRKINKVLSRGV